MVLGADPRRLGAGGPRRTCQLSNQGLAVQVERHHFVLGPPFHRGLLFSARAFAWPAAFAHGAATPTATAHSAAPAERLAALSIPPSAASFRLEPIGVRGHDGRLGVAIERSGERPSCTVAAAVASVVNLDPSTARPAISQNGRSLARIGVGYLAVAVCAAERPLAGWPRVIVRRSWGIVHGNSRPAAVSIAAQQLLLALPRVPVQGAHVAAASGPSKVLVPRNLVFPRR
mmetsp:Transcript_10442/g.29504  ORF Transcript_10442/g.29504 Transcript_10442/m.29504 type:complete len:230 (-) Transcript_10442:489-1178(-)